MINKVKMEFGQGITEEEDEGGWGEREGRVRAMLERVNRFV